MVILLTSIAIPLERRRDQSALFLESGCNETDRFIEIKSDSLHTSQRTLRSAVTHGGALLMQIFSVRCILPDSISQAKSVGLRKIQSLTHMRRSASAALSYGNNTLNYFSLNVESRLVNTVLSSFGI